MTKRRINYEMEMAREQFDRAIHGTNHQYATAKDKCLGIISSLESEETLPERFREELEDMYVQLMYV